MGKVGAVLQLGGIMNLGGKDVLHAALNFWLWSFSVYVCAHRSIFVHL